mmetsp:Transcript_4057/g.9599  ORF Transcript_4057/g.9599 Transcript_4057/m.9599 type:complete len:160 (+) Transcript_4057:127-606(+)
MFLEPLFYWAMLIFLGNCGLLLVMAARIFKHTELEEDHLNPVDFAKAVEWYFPLELCIHAFLMAMIFWFHFSTWLLLLNVPMLVWNIIQLSDNSYKVDPAKVWNPEWKKAYQRKTMIYLGFYGLCFAAYLYNVIAVILHFGENGYPRAKGVYMPHHLKD